MKKSTWIALAIIVLTILFLVFYPQLRRSRLPSGTPAERPLEK